MKKLKDQTKLKPLRFASSDRVGYLKCFVDEVLDAIKEVSGIDSAFVSDETRMGDYNLTEAEIKHTRQILGVKVFDKDYVVDIAQRIKDARG